MTHYRQTLGHARPLSEREAATLCPIAPACVLGCLAVAGLGGLVAFYWLAQPVWAATAGLVTGQIAFGLACLRVWLNGTCSMPGRSDEIEADLTAIMEYEVNASSR